MYEYKDLSHPKSKKDVCEMKKKNWMLILVMLILSCLVCGSLYASEKRNTATVTTHMYKDKEFLKYPQVSDMKKKKFEEKINKDFDQYIKNSYKQYKEIMKQAEQFGFEGQYVTTYEVKYNTKPKLSVLTSDYAFGGGAHGNTVVQSFNYCEEKEKRIYLTDILTTEEQINAVTNYVWEYAIERPDIFYPDLKKEDINLTKDTAFYFTDDGIVLVFQQYEIAPYVSGNQEIVIPSSIYK